ncbi:MAG: DUF58 domain-containing protein [Candidatus Nanoarchaeia archaeon]|nr:DUF58 domain-containing protein [Candidatus Nanoarchaeia archaeon]
MTKEIIKRELKVDLTPLIKKLEIVTKMTVSTEIMGGYRSFFKGVGLEFEDYKPYTQDDDASKIDWKASLRSDSLLVKQYREERNLEVFFLVDVSDNMVFGSGEKLKNEYVAELVASFVHVILNTGDKVGVALCSNDIVERITPSRSKEQFYAIGRTLVDPNHYGGFFDLKKSVNFLTRFLKKRSLVFIVSDFLNMDPGWEEDLRLASQKYDLVFISVRDPRDYEMPDKSFQIVIENPKTGEQMLVSPASIKERYKEYTKQQEETFKGRLDSLGIDYLFLKTDESFVQPLIALFSRRKKRWR